MNNYLSENPKLILILVGLLLIVAVPFTNSSFGDYSSLYSLIIYISSIILITIGYRGLVKTHNLKDENLQRSNKIMEEELKLIKKKMDEVDLNSEKMITEMAEKSGYPFPNVATNVFLNLEKDRIRREMKGKNEK